MKVTGNVAANLDGKCVTSASMGTHGRECFLKGTYRVRAFLLQRISLTSCIVRAGLIENFVPESTDPDKVIWCVTDKLINSNFNMYLPYTKRIYPTYMLCISSLVYQDCCF